MSAGDSNVERLGEGRSDNGLPGSTVLITGGTRGLGKAIAAAFVTAGANVAIAGRTAATAAAAAESLGQGAGRPARGFGVEVSDEASLEALVSAVEHEFGGIDTLVNCAGLNPWFVASEKTTLAQWREIVDVNLTGVFLGCRAVGRGMLERNRGNIINITSITARVGVPRTAAYCAAKAGVESLTRALAVEWATKGVRVNAVAPGYFETDLTAGLRKNQGLSEGVLARTPMRRFGVPHEVAGACVFLASDAASYITGQSLYVDGGMSGA
jgi:NAD(P)-dependent dehydrogenase (short-subunit alcohol dehydrogenase family)